MDKGLILRLVGIIIALSFSHTIANPAGSRYTGSNKESEPPNHAPLDDEDDNPFSGDLGMFSSSLTHKDETGKFDLNLSKNMEEVTPYLTDESGSMDLKNVSGMNEFDLDDNLPLGLQESYDGNFFEDDEGDECDFLKSIGIDCEPGSDSPTEEETEGDTDEKHTTSDTIVATLPFEDHTSTTATEKPFKTTQTRTEQALATTTTTSSAAMVTNKNQEKADENEIHTTISTIAITATSTATGKKILDATSSGATTTSERADKTQGLPSNATEDDDLDVVIPELIPVTSKTIRVTVATNTAESISTPESGVVEEVEIPAEPDRSTQSSTPKTTMTDIGEDTKIFPATETTTDKYGSVTNAAENVDTSEGNKLETTTAAATTNGQKKPAITTSQKQPSISPNDSAPPPGDDTLTTVDALKTITIKSATSQTVKMKDDVTPRTQGPTDSTPQPTTGTKTVTEAPAEVEKEKFTETVKTDEQNDDDAQQPFTSPESDKAKEDARTDSIAPQQAKLSTIILIVCIISLLIVLILVIVIIVIVRARLKRRGKYAITSEIESTEGGASGGQAGKSDVAQGGGEKVVTVQYNDSNA